MASWQAQLIKMVFRLRRIFKPPAGALDVEKSRLEAEALAANFKTKFELVCTPVNIHKVPAEWIATPETSAEGVMLYFHGGSYNSGSITSHRSLVANIAQSAKTRALTVAYSLAPEFPFPAAVEDAVAAYRWLLENRFRPDQIVVAGDSSGGGLALSLLVCLRDANEPLPAAAVCLSPWTDLTCSGDSWQANAKQDVLLDRRFMLESARLYVGESDPRTPLASPLYADLKGLPPILIQAASDELILSDATGVADRARAAGVDVTLEVWEGMQHEWHFAETILPESRQAIQHIGRFIETHIG